MSLSVNADVCGATGFCVSIAPEVFALDDVAGVARVLRTDDLAGELLERVREAEAACPTVAIRLRMD